MDRLRSLLPLLLAIALVSTVLVTQADLALHKPFWLDEGHEIVKTCERSTAGLLLRGAHECSPAPLYWVAQGIVVRSVEPLGLSLRLEYRAVSLTAAATALLLLLLGLRTLGFATALVAGAVLLADPGFHFYAAQNRAYMTWAAATTLLVVVAAEVSVLERARLRWGLPALLVAGGLVGLTALPGCVQAAGAFAACAAVRHWLTPGERVTRAQVAALGLGALAIAALDAHYWAGSPCRAYQGADEYGLDMVIATDRALMVRRALTVIWPEGYGPWVLLGHLALLVGAAVPFLLWRRRSTLDRPERYAAALSLVALSQLLAMAPVAAGLIGGRYLFLPRMFIFAMISRAVLVAVGFWWAASLVSRLPGRASRWSPAVLAALLAAGALWRADGHIRSLKVPVAPVGAVSCDALRAPALRLLEPEAHTPEFTPNFLVRLGRALEACAATPVRPGAPRYLLALDPEGLKQTEWMRIEDQPAPGFGPLRVCGRPVLVESGHARLE